MLNIPALMQRFDLQRHCYKLPAAPQLSSPTTKSQYYTILIDSHVNYKTSLCNFTFTYCNGRLEPYGFDTNYVRAVKVTVNISNYAIPRSLFSTLNPQKCLCSKDRRRNGQTDSYSFAFFVVHKTEVL